jgi:hypothetical protein
MEHTLTMQQRIEKNKATQWLVQGERILICKKT